MCTDQQAGMQTVHTKPNHIQSNADSHTIEISVQLACFRIQNLIKVQYDAQYADQPFQQSNLLLQ